MKIRPSAIFCLLPVWLLAGCPAYRANDLSSAPAPGRPPTGVPAPAPAKFNGEGYNGPDLMGYSIPVPVYPNRLTTKDLEFAANLCFQQSFTGMLIKIFKGDIIFDPASASNYVITEKFGDRNDDFVTTINTFFTFQTASGERYRAHWHALAGYLGPELRAKHVPSMALRVSRGAPEILTDREDSDWEKTEVLHFRVFDPLPRYVMRGFDPEDLTSKLFVRDGILDAVFSDLFIENVGSTFRIFKFTADGVPRSVGLNVAELSQCLQFGMANTIDYRIPGERK